jgi:hypothetical protein
MTAEALRDHLGRRIGAENPAEEGRARKNAK